jgi:diguanylate cyclase (GGDEF)-like protein
MFRISKKTVWKASLAAIASMAVSLAAALILVPILGGHPDGPGFWMSVVCPLGIAFPASAWQFHQQEMLTNARDELARLHSDLDIMHNELMQTHAILKEQARRDAMTGALNRETFFSLLDAASQDNRPSALLIADADHFKRINDTFGHRYGDAALKEIARAISSVLRPQDFWGRIGGEEFAAYLDQTDEREAALIAERLRAAAEAIDLQADDTKIPVTLSIGGICLSSRFNATHAASEADRRLYVAKRGGRNTVVMNDPEADSQGSEAA